MKLVTFLFKNKQRLGVYSENKIIDLNANDNRIPDNMQDFLSGGDLYHEFAHNILNNSPNTIELHANLTIYSTMSGFSPCSRILSCYIQDNYRIE